MNGGLIVIPCDTPDEYVKEICKKLKRVVLCDDDENDCLIIRYYGKKIDELLIVEMISKIMHPANIWQIV